MSSGNEPAVLNIIQHHRHEGPGRLADWAQRRGIALACFDATRGELPERAEPVVLLGGPASTLQPPPWLRTELAWLKDRLHGPTPVLGICLGAQLLAVAAGGGTEPMTTPELGWTPLPLDDGSTLDVLQWHQDRILPPAAARIDIANAACVQMFSLGSARLGVQFHPEWDDAALRALHAGFDSCPLPAAGDARRQLGVDRWFGQLMARWSECPECSADAGP